MTTLKAPKTRRERKTDATSDRRRLLDLDNRLAADALRFVIARRIGFTQSPAGFRVMNRILRAAAQAAMSLADSADDATRAEFAVEELTRVIVEVEGGVVQAIYSDGRSPISVTVLDRDDQKAEEGQNPHHTALDAEIKSLSCIY